MKAEYTPAENLLSCFTNIDEKIELLHDCSNEVFFTYNNTLNETFQIVDLILEKVCKLYEGPMADEKTGLPASIKNFTDDLREKFVDFEQQINLMYSLLEKIEANFSLMFSPISNFRHNLTALKPFLLTLNLPNSNINNRSDKKKYDSHVDLSDKVIDKIIVSCPVFEENIFNIKQHIGLLRQDLAVIKDTVAPNILKNYDNVLDQLNKINAKYNYPLIDKEKVEKIKGTRQHADDSNFTNFEHQDIFWNNLEHIRKTHKMLSEELYETSNIGSVNGQRHKLRYMPHEVANLQIGQLICANEDYRNITEQINQKIEHIGQHVGELVEICFVERTDPEIEIKLLYEQIADLTNTVKKGIDNYSVLATEIGLVNKIVNDLYSKYLDIDLIDNAVEQGIIDKINFSNLLLSPESETASQAQQILKLYAANHFEKNKLKTLFESGRLELKEFICTDMEFVGGRKGIEKIHETVLNTRLHSEAIIENIAWINNTQNDIRGLGEEINIAAQKVVNSIKIHDIFESTIEQLLGQIELVSCIARGKKQKMNGKKRNHAYFFEKIEEYFAMKPENNIQYVYNSNMLGTRNL